MAYSSIDLDGLERVVNALDRAQLQLVEADDLLRPQASTCGISTLRPMQVGQTGDWSGEQLPMLRRRLELAQALDAARPANMRGNDVSVEEPVLSREEAAEQGGELADQFDDLMSNPDVTSEDVAALAEQMEAHQGDPEVMSAFYSRVDPYQVMLLLETTEGADPSLETFSRGLAAALHDTDPPEAFAEYRASSLTEPETSAEAYSRMALLTFGGAPTSYVTQLTRVNALDIMHGEDQPQWDARYTLVGSPVDGLANDGYGLAFQVLANDPSAARQAIGAPPGVEATTDFVNGYGFSHGSGDDTANYFGMAVEAGAGVNDEEMGEHSYPASTFAFEVMTAMADQDEVPFQLRDSMGRLAGSYAPELLIGSRVGDADSRESALTSPDNFDSYPGLNPSFYLSAEDTRNFLRTFGHDDELAAPFDEAVGVLWEDVLGEAARLDAEDDGDRFGRAAGLFGNLSGAQYDAQLDVRGDLDDRDQAIRDAIGWILGKGVGAVPTPQGLAAKYGWKAASYIINRGISEWQQGDPESTRVALAEDANVQAAFLNEYSFADILVRNNPAYGDTVPPELQGPDGGLISPDQIAEDPDLIEAFMNWTDSTDADGEENTLDKETDAARERFDGGQQGFIDQWGVADDD